MSAMMIARRLSTDMHDDVLAVAHLTLIGALTGLLAGLAALGLGSFLRARDRA